MLTDKQISYAASATNSSDSQVANEAVSALICSTVQAIHSIARSLELIAGPPDVAGTIARKSYGGHS